MKEVLEQQTKHLENLDTSAKKDTLIQLLQLREEMKIDKEDGEHLEKVKETNKILNRAVNIDINMAKDVKEVTKVLTSESSKQQLEVLDKLQKSLDDLNGFLKKRTVLDKDDKVASANKPMAGIDPNKKPIEATGTNRREQNLDARLNRRETWRQNQTSGLRNFLIGANSKGQGGFLDNILTKRENAMADKRLAKMEKREFIAGAKENDTGTIGVKNLAGGVNTKGTFTNPNWLRRIKGNLAAEKYAGAKFDALKEKEDVLVAQNDKIKSAEKAGYAPKVKDVEAAKAARKDVLATDDMRENSLDKAEARAEKARAKENKRTEKVEAKQEVVKPATNFSQSSEDKEEGKAERLKFESDTIVTEGKQAQELEAMGKTLLESLAVHKDMLQALKEGGAGGGGGGSSLLGDAADAASNFMGKGKGMLGKAGKFLGKHAGKIGAVAGIAAGAYEAYEGWGNANEKEEAANKDIDAKVASGEISKDQAMQMRGEASDTSNVEKGEAVGGGAGGAAGAWAGAAAGAAVGSAVPIVGTAIGGLVGGAIGYYGGSKLGAGIGGALTKGYQGVRNFFGGGPDTGNKGVQAAQKTEENYDMKFNDGKPTINGQSVSQEDYMKAHNAPLEQRPEVIKSILNKPVPEGSGTANAIQNKTNELNDTKDAAANKGNNSPIVAAPVTNINNSNTQNNTTRLPIRSEDNSLNHYVKSRYAAY